MQGTILGFSADSGAISADDGTRFTFTRDDWKSDGDPRPETTVDFVAGEDGEAKEIYALKRAGSDLGAELGTALGRSGESLKKLAQGDGANSVVDRMRAQPQIVIAGLIIFVSLFFTYVSLDLSGESNSSLVRFSLFGSGEFSDIADTASDRANSAIFMTDDMRNELYGVAAMLNGLAWLALSLLTVPAFAGWTIYASLKGRSTKLPEILTMAAVLWAILFCFIARGLVAEIVGTYNQFRSADSVREAWSLGFGGWLMLLLGAALGTKAFGIWKVGGPASGAKSTEADNKA